MAVTTTLPDILVTASRLPPAGTAGGSGGSGHWGEPNISREDAYEIAEQVFTPSCAQSATMDNRIDANFIADREGAALPNGYVPSSNSGVTVATGVDLGQRNITDLQRLGLPQPLITKLTPYLGLKGSAASAYLASNPLTLTSGQVATLDSRVHTEIYAELMVNFEAGSAFRFMRLPAAAQTVLASVALQYGAALQYRTPSFFSAMRQGRWQDAVNELRNFGDAFPTRRNLEADVLESAIDSGAMPTSC